MARRDSFLDQLAIGAPRTFSRLMPSNVPSGAVPLIVFQQPLPTPTKTGYRWVDSAKRFALRVGLAVRGSMFGISTHYLKIFTTVVRPIVVQMMDVLISAQRAAQRLFHNPTMLAHAPTRSPDADVARRI